MGRPLQEFLTLLGHTFLEPARRALPYLDALDDAIAVIDEQTDHAHATVAAAGLTNKQIGERLYLSPRSVGAHLYQLFPKLGGSRSTGGQGTRRAERGSRAPTSRSQDAYQWALCLGMRSWVA